MKRERERRRRTVCGGVVLDPQHAQAPIWRERGGKQKSETKNKKNHDGSHAKHTMQKKKQEEVEEVHDGQGHTRTDTHVPSAAAAAAAGVQVTPPRVSASHTHTRRRSRGSVACRRVKSHWQWPSLRCSNGGVYVYVYVCVWERKEKRREGGAVARWHWPLTLRRGKGSGGERGCVRSGERNRACGCAHRRTQVQRTERREWRGKEGEVRRMSAPHDLHRLHRQPGNNTQPHRRDVHVGACGWLWRHHRIKYRERREERYGGNTTTPSHTHPTAPPSASCPPLQYSHV